MTPAREPIRTGCACRPRGAVRLRTRLMLLGGVFVTMLPVTAPTLAASGADGGAAYGGFTVAATATPVRIEIFEPSIPIPVDAGKAQLELSMGYSTVRADTGQSTGRSSLFWPGDPVGEGLKTFAEQLGFPPSPLTDNGYPVQVNAQFPGDTTSQSDERIPGTVQRTSAGEATAVAETGFSPDGAVVGPPEPEAPGTPAPADPLSGLTGGLQSLLDGLGALGSLGGIGAPKSSAAGNPLGALVDVDGYVAVSRLNATKSPVTAAARSTIGEIRILGGLITLGGVETVARATSDGAKAETTGRTAYGSLTIAGQRFAMGPDGITASGQTSAIPGLNTLPLDLLEQLGVTIEAPDGVRKVEGDQGTSNSQGLRITLDLKTLAPVLQALPTAVLADLIPAEAGPLRGVVAGLSSLSPRIVLTVGFANAVVDTVPPIEATAAVEDAAPTADAAPAAAAGGPVAGAVGVPSTVPGSPVPTGAAPSVDAGQAEVLADAAPASAGLPELFSIPGVLLLVAFAGAAFAGTWFRRLGVAALGGGAPCTHGLASGLPDLRKA